jgi:hypothetical protein
MDSTDRTLLIFVTLGALAGLAYRFWYQIVHAGWLVSPWVLVGCVATGAFCLALLAIAPHMGVKRAAGYAALHGAVIALLMAMVTLRYAELSDLWQASFLALPLTALLLLPLPFWIAHALGDWRDYDALFEQAYQIALRFILALVFAAVVWVLMSPFDNMLRLVGLGYQGWLVEHRSVDYMITGANWGIGVAIAGTGVGAMGVRVALTMLRPLLVPVTVAVALFLISLAFREPILVEDSGFDDILMIMGLAAALISAVVDTQASATPPHRILVLSARMMAGMMPLLGALALMAVVQGMQEYGRTQLGVIGGCASCVALAYGLSYAAAAPRADWMARIRRANVTLVLATIAVAALTLTPLLDAEPFAQIQPDSGP